MKIGHKFTLTLTALSLSLTGSYAQHFEEANDPQPAHLIAPANQINKTQCINRFLATLPDHVTEQRCNAMRAAALQYNALQLHDLGLETLDGLTLGALTWLQELNLSNNKLRVLPVQLSNLKKLHFLDISKNGFINFPLVVTHLHNLKTLIAGNEVIEDEALEPDYGLCNIFTNLPSAIARLKNLRVLKVRYGCLERLPDAIGFLPELKELDLISNNIRELPSTIRRLNQLQDLGLQLNPLVGLPIEIDELENLKFIAVNFIYPTVFPTAFNRLNNIQQIGIAEDEVLPEGLGQGLGVNELLQAFGDKLIKNAPRLRDVNARRLQGARNIVYKYDLRF